MDVLLKLLVYDPLASPIGIILKEEKVFRWLKNGAQPTDTVRSLLQRKGVWFKWHLMKKGVDENSIASALEKWQSTQAEKAAREAAKRVRRRAKKKSASQGEVPVESTAPAA